jgi:hypothetical protein
MTTTSNTPITSSDDTIGSASLHHWAYAIPAAAVVYGIGLALRGPLVNPAALVNPADRAAWANWITEPTFRPGYLLLTIGLILQLLGFVGLYLRLPARRRRLATAGLLASFTGVAFNITIHGVALLTPEAYPSFTDAVQGANPDPSVLIGAGLVQLSVLGALLFAIALWRTPGIARWVAVAYLAHRLAFDFGGIAHLAVEASGVLFLFAAGIAIIRYRATTR